MIPCTPSPATAASTQTTLGNGNNDAVTLGSGHGGDYIATGRGSGDTVTVGASFLPPDTFAFALGTNGTNFTTVSGATAGDHVVVNGGQLGNTPSPLFRARRRTPPWRPTSNHWER